MIAESPLGSAPLFLDRVDAGAELAARLEDERGAALVVVGMARGGVQVAAEVARRLDAPLDVVAVRKIGHPWQPEYGLGAVTPGDGVYVRGSDGLTDAELAAAVKQAQTKAVAVDGSLHAELAPLDLRGKIVVLVDDGLATGGTMIAAIRWAKAAGAARVVAAVPVAASDSLALVRDEADELVCPHRLAVFLAVGLWYASFEQLDDADVIALLRENRTRSVGEVTA